MKTINQKMKSLSAGRRKKIEARALALIAEEMTLQELRRARKITQVRLAKTLGISQDGVSRLEKRSDLLLSTLRKSVEAMGGNLSLVAEFPDREPVILSGSRYRRSQTPREIAQGAPAVFPSLKIGGVNGEGMASQAGREKRSKGKVNQETRNGQENTV